MYAVISHICWSIGILWSIESNYPLSGRDFKYFIPPLTVKAKVLFVPKAQLKKLLTIFTTKHESRNSELMQKIPDYPGLLMEPSSRLGYRCWCINLVSYGKESHLCWIRFPSFHFRCGAGKTTPPRRLRPQGGPVRVGPVVLMGICVIS